MTEFIVSESVLMDEPLSDYDAMRVFFELADERGHLAPSVVVDDNAQLVTHRDYSDRVGAVHEAAGAWAFCRQPLPEALGVPEGAGWVRQIAPHLLLQDSVPYPSEPVFNHQPYLQRFGSDTPIMLPPVANAAAITIAPDGMRVCVLEERARGGYAVHEYELGLGTQRLVATFPAGAGWFLSDVAYGPDGRWVLVTGAGRACLVQLSDGLVVPLPIQAEAAAWNPGQGPNALLLMSTDQIGGRLLVQDYDLASGKHEMRSAIKSREGRPLDVRQMAVSADERVLVIAPVGTDGMEQAPRGGVWLAAQIDVERGTIDPVAPARFDTPQVSRRHSNPRWSERPAPVAGTTTPHPGLVERGRTLRDEQPPPVERWQPVVDAIIRAWRSGAVPPGTLAQELIQFTLSCDEQKGETLRQLVELGRGQAIPRVVRQRIEDGRRLWTPIAADPPPAAETAPPVVPAAVERLVRAGDSVEAALAVRDLAAAADGEPWPWLAEQSARALRTGAYESAALIALCSLRWHNHPAADGLGTASRETATILSVNGFTACTHLPERQELARIGDELQDAESVREACHLQLRQLGYEAVTGAGRSPRKPRKEPTVITRPRFSEGTTKLLSKAFISYQRDDHRLVEPIVARLRNAGIEVWFDRDDLQPGHEWPREIRKAIRTGGAFVPIFSPRYVARDRTYMNEELRQAIEQARRLHVDRQRLVPVMLETCEIPDMQIDSTRYLTDIHFVDFTADWNAAMESLIKTLRSILDTD